MTMTRYKFLGRVDELFDDDPCGHEMHACQAGLAQLRIPRGHAATWFEVMKEPCDLLPSLRERFILVSRGSAMALWRYDRAQGMHDAVCSQARAVVPLLPHGMGHRRHGRPRRQHRRNDGTLRTMAGRQDERDTGACIATARRDCGRPAAPRAAQSLGGVAAVFFSRARGGLLGAAKRRIEKELAGQRTGVRLATLPAWAPAPAPCPAAQAVSDGVPVAKRLWQVTPRCPRAGQGQHGCAAPPSAAHRGTPSPGCESGADGGKLRPGLLSQQHTYRHQVPSSRYGMHGREKTYPGIVHSSTRPR